MRTYIGHDRAGRANVLTGMIRSVLSRRQMNFNGPSQIVTNGACPAPLDAIVHLAAIKTVAKCRLANLFIWVSREQRGRE
jgi:hypothetical protein